MKTPIRWAIAGVLAASAMAAVPAQADEGPFEIRLRAVYLDFAQKSDAFVLPTDLAGNVSIPADAVTLNKKWIPDLNFEYFFTPNWSAELVLTYPQSQDVKVNVPALGAVAVGSFKHLPPVLTAKYNFLPGQDFRPYVGVGVNLTIFSNVDLNVPAVPGVQSTPVALDLNSTSVGIAGQLGFDYKVADHWLVNADVKYVKLSTDVNIKASGQKVTTVNADPWLLGVGVGYRF